LPSSKVVDRIDRHIQEDAAMILVTFRRGLPERLATLPFIEHDLVTFDYIELADSSPA
jgi:hypothetical protein